MYSIYRCYTLLSSKVCCIPKELVSFDLPFILLLLFWVFFIFNLYLVSFCPGWVKEPLGWIFSLLICMCIDFILEKHQCLLFVTHTQPPSQLSLVQKVIYLPVTHCCLRGIYILSVCLLVSKKRLQEMIHTCCSDIENVRCRCCVRLFTAHHLCPSCYSVLTLQGS